MSKLLSDEERAKLMERCKKYEALPLAVAHLLINHIDVMQAQAKLKDEAYRKLMNDYTDLRRVSHVKAVE